MQLTSRTMNTISISYFVLLVIISLLPYQNLSKGQAQKGNDLITKTCEHTRFKSLCMAALKSDNESKAADLQGLAKISLKIALSNASETHHYVSELLNKTKDKCMLQCLKDCSKSYKQGIEQIEKSISALSSKGYGNVNTWVSTAMTNAKSCEDGFQGKFGYKCPFTKMNKFFTRLCSISLSITNLLVGGGFRS